MTNAPTHAVSADVTAIDTQARGPLLLLLGSGLVWLVLSGILALITSIQLHTPAFMADCAWFTVGRAQALRETTFVYGWGANVGLGIGLWIFGVPNPVLWGVLAGIASVIPSIGTAIVAVPAVLFLLATSTTGAAIGLAAWSVVLVGTIDNLLNPIVLGKRVSLPPLIVLFSVLGGIALFGAAGIIIGPLSTSLLYTLLLIYREHFKPAS